MNNKAKHENTVHRFPRFLTTIREHLKEISSAGAGCTNKELAKWYGDKYPKAVEEKIRKFENIKIRLTQ